MNDNNQNKNINPMLKNMMGRTASSNQTSQNEINNQVIQNEVNTLNKVTPVNTLDLSTDAKAPSESIEEVKEEINSLDLTNTNIDSSIISKQDKEINTINLNNVATPIGVDEVTNKDEYKEYVIKRSNSKLLLFITLILLCVVAILFIVAYLYLPEYNNKHKYNLNDKTTTKEISDYLYIVKKLSKTSIKDTKTFKINDNFTLKTEKINKDIMVYINDVDIVSLKRVYGTVATLDDLIIFAGDDTDARSAKLVVVDKNGKVINQIDSGDSKEARIVNKSINMTQEAIIYTATKVDGINLYANNEVYNICDKDLESKAHIDKNFVIENTYELVYKKNHEFNDLKSIENKTLETYLKESKVCK